VTNPAVATVNVTMGLKSIYLGRKSALQAELSQLQNAPNSNGGGGTAIGTGSGVADATAPNAFFSKEIIYNAPAVKEAYFRQDMSFFNEKGEQDNYIFAGNTPANKVKDAIELWNKVKGGTDNRNNSKGMIQTWKNPANQFTSLADNALTNIVNTGTGQIQRYGFQFIYNPTSVTLNYGGVSDVDPGWAASGKEKFILSNPTVFQSSISVDVLINRIYDMKYLGPNGQLKGKPAPTIPQLYDGNRPTQADLKKIYQKGTMYDVEFLLQTMFPYNPIPSQLRGKTSDVGFLGPSPVEMHLGNKLRYLVQINSITVNHVLLDNRMVPLYSWVTISANRIPDAKSGLQAGGGA